MPNPDDFLKDAFQFGTTTVRMLQGSILEPRLETGEAVRVDAVVSTDDNYLTMSSGIAALLRKAAGHEAYMHQAQAQCSVQSGLEACMRQAQSQCHVRAGTVVVTEPFALHEKLGVEYVLHGTVVDYDSEDLPLEDLVAQTTANCLETADALGLESILFPAFATGAGGLAMDVCARQMCKAIKAYLGQERSLKRIYIVLRMPEAEGEADSAERIRQYREKNRPFVREANLVLGAPYDPRLGVRQTRDFYGREEVLQQLETLILGQNAEGKRHAVILGGPAVGKWGLLDQIYCRAQQPDSPLSTGRRLVKLTFGRVHENTPASFVYRKFLCALASQERGDTPEDEALRMEIRAAYSDPEMNCEKFLAFLGGHQERYPEIVFLIDHLPKLLRMESIDYQDPRGVQAFWRDLDKLQERVRFVYTARDEEYAELRDDRLEEFTKEFPELILEIRLACVGEEERRTWVQGLYRRYLDRDASELEHDFFAREAGRHPYLVSLAGYALIQVLKQDALANPTRTYDELSLERFFQAARQIIEGPRQAFFDRLMRTVQDDRERLGLENLAKAVFYRENQKEFLLEFEDLQQRIAQAGFAPQILERMQELNAMPKLRLLLDEQILQRLEAQGYLVEAQSLDTVEFMAPSFAAYAAQFFGVMRPQARAESPKDIVIGLMGPDEGSPVDGGLIETMFRGSGARIITAKTPLRHKPAFMSGFDQLVRHEIHPVRYPEAGDFPSLAAVGDYILSNFTTGMIRGHLKSLPKGSSILLEIDDVLKDIPWELMLEAVYIGEIPFELGRRLISSQPPGMTGSPVRGGDRIRALLIGDPTGDLVEAGNDVSNLAEKLRNDGRFQVEDTDVLIGPDACRLIPLQQKLRSGVYGLIHYSGHSVFEDEQSAWLLSDGQRLNTFDLTASLRDAPPVLVFSSSCESAAAGEPRAIKYEDQTFDLPSAFLQAGTEAYVGTLWEVESLASRLFGESFYDSFLKQAGSLGECLRAAKMALKQKKDAVNWPAFVLYGDPHITPGDLFPAMRGPAE